MIQKPRLYLRNNHDKTIATFNPDQYYDATIEFFLKGKIAVLEFTVLKDDLSYNTIDTSCYVSFKMENTDYWMECVIVEQDEYSMKITAWPVGLEYNNENMGPFSASSQTFEWYFNQIVFGAGVKLGKNEVADKKISIEWTGSDAKLARLYSLANYFDAEIEFETQINRDGSLANLYVHVYKKYDENNQGVGRNRKNEVFSFGDEIQTVRKNEDKTEFYSAIHATGKDGLTIKSLDKEVKDKDGNLEYVTKPTSTPDFGDPEKVYAPMAADRWPSNITTNDRWAVYYAGETQYESAEALYGYMLGELKKHAKMNIEWTIEGYIDARIGDSVRIRDDAYKPVLFLNARVSEQKLDLDHPENSQTTFTNVDVLSSKLSEDILAKVDELMKQAKTYTYYAWADSEDGVIDFTTEKPSDGSIKRYRGIAVTNSPTAPVSPSSYTWEPNPYHIQDEVNNKVDDDRFVWEQEHTQEKLNQMVPKEQYDLLYEAFLELQQKYESFTSPAGEFNTSLESLKQRDNAIEEKFDEKAVAWSFLDTYFKAGPEGLMIGKDGLDMLLSGDRLSFMQNGVEMAYFSNQNFHIGRGVITDSLTVGAHKLTKVDSNRTIIEWIGGA